MVFFQCDACGQSVKKNQVEKHYTIQCLNCSVLSCLDCGKEFRGETYKEHIKCISEDEKYGGKDYKPKLKKGEAKQEQWTKHVQEALSSAKDPRVKTLLQQISDCPNVPRKKTKFENFVKNSFKVRDQHLVDQVWILFSDSGPKMCENNGESNNGGVTTGQKSSDTHATSNGQTSSSSSAKDPDASDEKVKKKNKREKKEERKNKGKAEKKDTKKEKKKMGEADKKRKREEQVEEEDAQPKKKLKGKQKKIITDEKESTATQDSNPDSELETSAREEKLSKKFNINNMIKAILRRESGKELPMKKLKKKVLGEFRDQGGDPRYKSEDIMLAAFKKKVISNSKFKVIKDQVKLVK